MAHRNGKPRSAPEPTFTPTQKAKDALARLHEHKAEMAAEIASRKLRRLKESVSWDWWTPWVDVLRDHRGEPGWFPINSPSAHRHGNNFPFYQNEQQLGIIRDLSRSVVGTSSHAKGLLRGYKAFVIGTGFKFKVSPQENTNDTGKAAAKRITTWLDKWAVLVRWYERQQEQFNRTQRDGDGLMVEFARDDGWLDLRFRWPEQLIQPPGTTLDQWSYGIETPEDDTETYLSYHFTPLNNYGVEGKYHDAADVLHTVDRETDSGVKRGLPLFSFDARDQFDTAARLAKNLGEGSAVRAAIAYMRQHSAATEEEVSALNVAGADYQERRPFQDTYTPVTKIDGGSVVDFPEGMEHVAPPADPTTEAHSAVVEMLVECGCARINAPPWLASSSITEMGAYTSSLVAESPFVKGVVADQEYYRTRFLKVVHRALDHAAAHGLITQADLDLVTVDLVPPNPEVRDKLQEAQRAQTEIPLGVQSRQNYCSEQGRDFDRIAEDNQQYQETYGKDGEASTDPDGGTGGSLFDALGQRKPFHAPSLGESLQTALDTAIGRLLLEHGFTGTDRLGRKWVDGKEVAADKAGSGQQAAGSEAPSREHVLDGLAEKITAADPEVAKTPGLLAKLGDRALTAAAKVHLALLSATPAMLRVMSLAGDVLDTPDDLKKFGYNPTLSSGVAGHDTGDPLKANLGISTHLAATIATHMLSRGLLWVKKQLAGKPEADEGDVYAGAAEVLTAVLAALAEEFGLPAPDSQAVEAALRSTADRAESIDVDEGTLRQLVEAGQLVKKQITVHRGGKTFTQTRLVRPDKATSTGRPGTAQGGDPAGPKAAAPTDGGQKPVPTRAPKAKATRAAIGLINIARRRRVIAAVKNEGELAQAVSGFNLPDSEPADVVRLTDAAGKPVTDQLTVRHFLKGRERAVRILKDKKLEKQHADAERVLSLPADFFEVKTLLTSKSGKARMSRQAIRRKERWMDRYGIAFHVVLIDDRRGTKHSGHRVYVAPAELGGTIDPAHMKKADDLAAVLTHIRG